MDQSVVVNSSPGSGQTRKRQNQDPAGGALKDMARPNNVSAPIFFFVLLRLAP